MARNGFYLALVALVFAGSLHGQCLPGGLAVIVNKSNKVESLSMAQLRKLILGDVRAWQNQQAVVLVSRDQSSKVFACVLSAVVRQSSGDYHRYIINAEFRGDEPMAIQTVDSDASAARAVSGNPGGLAVVEANSATAISGTVKVIRIEGKAVGQPGYPL